jgi:YidC/Oxa1 family membrane protein insertase
MRFFDRLAIVCATIVIFSGFCVSAAHAQNEKAFVNARQLELHGTKEQVLKDYSSIVRNSQRNDPETAAEALYREGMYALGPAYASTPADKAQGQDAAIQAWTQLTNDFPKSKAAAKILEPLKSPQDSLYGKLQNEIDVRNSHDWKYQIINSLVKLTGSKPAYSYWFALILLAGLVKLILLPLTRKQYAGMREMQRMQPLIKELQKKYKGQELSQKQMELYKEHGVNPFASCFPTLLQLPFLILIYNGIRTYEYAFAHGHFLWIGSSLSKEYPHIVATNLSQPDIPLLVIYTLTNYVTMRLTPATDPQQQQQQNTMAIMTSALFFYMFLSYRWSSAFVLYWLALNGFSIWQQYELVFKPQRQLKMQALEAGNIYPDKKTNASSNNGNTASQPVNAQDTGNTAAGQPARVRPRKKKR